MEAPARPGLRVAFMGTPDFAVPILRALSATPACQVVMVFSQPDRRRGRGRQLAPSPVRAWAQQHGLPTATPTRLRDPEAIAGMAALHLDLVVVAAYGRLLPPAMLAVARLGCVNVHASLLPALRGAAPVAHALLAGLAETGVSIMRMEAGLDTGPVWRRAALALAPTARCGETTARLAELGARELLATLPDIVAGRPPARQDDAAASWAPMLAKADGRLDWRLPATALERRVRAFDPWPGAHTEAGGGRLAIVAAEVEAAAAAAEPGRVVAVSARGVLVGSGEGCLWLTRVQPAGRPAMAAADWARGRRIGPGATVGEVGQVG